MMELRTGAESEKAQEHGGGTHLMAGRTEDHKSDFEKTKPINFCKFKKQPARSGEKIESRTAACKGPVAEAELLFGGKEKKQLFSWGPPEMEINPFLFPWGPPEMEKTYNFPKWNTFLI
jgi:hypothetical protein